MIDRVVVATDGSASVDRAVVTAVDLADRFQAAVHALYVLDEDEVADAPAEERDTARATLREAGEAALEAVDRSSAGPVETTIRTGDPATEIVAHATDVDADVIAVGSRGRHGEHRYLLGSVAEAVVRRSPCPVLSVRQLEATGGTGRS